MQTGQLATGRFELGKRFESGSGSEVFLARDRKENALVVAKLIKSPYSQEGQILQKLDHEGIIRLKGQYDTPEGLLLVEEFFPGVSLKHYVRKRRMLSAREAIRITEKIADILQYLHSRKPPIIYRDLKPDNLMIDADGNIRLIDFGAAKEYARRCDADEVCVGTLGYAAPEQFRGSFCQSDIRTDIYGLGAIMYFMLTGLDPEEEGGFPYPLDHLRKDIPKRICEVVDKCLRPDPEERYQGAESLLYDLRQCMKKGPF